MSHYMYMQLQMKTFSVFSYLKFNNKKKESANEAHYEWKIKNKLNSVHSSNRKHFHCIIIMNQQKKNFFFLPKCGTDTVTWLFELTSKVATFERSKLVGLKSSGKNDIGNVKTGHPTQQSHRICLLYLHFSVWNDVDVLELFPLNDDPNFSSRTSLPRFSLSSIINQPKMYTHNL